MENKLFVYGTLAPGRPNEHLLRDIKGTWAKATISGVLHPQGWGAALGYPGIVLNPTGDKINGYLFSSEQLHEHWERLDEFEGPGYQRVLTDVIIECGKKEKAYVYELKACDN